MTRPVLLLPPLRDIDFSSSDLIAATPVWSLSATAPEISTLGAWQNSTIELWLDPADMLLTQLKLPNLPEKRLRQALPHIIADKLVGDIASLHCTPGPQGSNELRWVSAVPLKALEDLLKVLQSQDVSVERIGSPALTLIKQPNGVTVWENPAKRAEQRWAMHLGNDLLGGDTDLAEAFGARHPGTQNIALGDHPNWNLIVGHAIDPANSKHVRTGQSPTRLPFIQPLASGLILPLSVFALGLCIDTIRLALEKRHLTDIPVRLFQSLNPGQELTMAPGFLLNRQLDQLKGQFFPESDGRQLLPLLDAAARLRTALPKQPAPLTTEFAQGKLTLKFSAAPQAQPVTQGQYSVKWERNGHDAIITFRESP